MKGNAKKLVNILNKKDEELVISAMNAIDSISEKKSLKEMLKRLNSERYSFTDASQKKEKNTNITKNLEKLIQKNKEKYSEILIEELLSDITLMKKKFDPNNYIESLQIWDRIENYKALILKMNDSVISNLVPLINHDDIDIRFHFTQILNLLKKKSNEYRDILERERPTIWKGKRFGSLNLDRYLLSKNSFEIPVFSFSCDTNDGTTYLIGLTDKFLYVHVDTDVLSGKGSIHNFPLAVVDKIVVDGERNFSIYTGRQEQSNEYDLILRFVMSDGAIAMSSIHSCLPNEQDPLLLLNIFIDLFQKIKNDNLQYEEINKMSLCKRVRLYGKSQ